MSNLKRRTLSSIENLHLDEETDNETVCYLENNFPDESMNYRQTVMNLFV